jgi:catechol 2,3-dioxygenase-like lactoylglutathione lyase family enzyme
MANISGPDFITILVSDLKASYSFYKEKIGLPESAEKRRNAHAFQTKPCGFAIRQASDDRKIKNPGQGIILWWRSADATALHHDLKEPGSSYCRGTPGGPVRHDIFISRPGWLHHDAA